METASAKLPSQTGTSGMGQAAGMDILVGQKKKLSTSIKVGLETLNFPLSNFGRAGFREIELSTFAGRGRDEKDQVTVSKESTE